MEKKKTRESNIELLRIIGMLMVVAHHYVVNSGILNGFEPGNTSLKFIFLNLWGMWGKTGINLFVLISGYFMCKNQLTMKRYCKVLFEWILYHFGIYLVMLVAGYETAGLRRLFDLTFEIFRHANESGSFENSFFIFYLFIPFMNKFIQSISKTEFKRFVLYLIFVFTVLSTFFFNYAIFGEVFWFSAVYFIGAYLRIYPPQWSVVLKSSGRLLLLSLLVSYASVVLLIFVDSKLHRDIVMFFVSDANKLGAVLVSIFMFATFKNLRIGYSKMVNLVAKTTFGVLLIHSNNGALRQYLWQDLLHVDTFYSLPFGILVMKSILITAGVFAVCSLIDIIRIYLIERPVFDHFDRFEAVIRKAWESISAIGRFFYNGVIRLVK